MNEMRGLLAGAGGASDWFLATDRDRPKGRTYVLSKSGSRQDLSKNASVGL